MRIIIDTCVALDYMQNRGGFESDASHVIALCCMRVVDGFFTSKSFADLYYLMHHFLHSNEETRIAIAKWRTAIGILDVKGDDCLAALASPISDYEDAIMSEVAKREDVDYIVTRNCSDYRKSEIPAVTPSEFISLLMRSIKS